MKLVIERTDNGFIASHQEEEGLRWQVFEEPEDAVLDPDPKTFSRLLWYVISYFGATGSKHDSERVTVSVSTLSPSKRRRRPQPDA